MDGSNPPQGDRSGEAGMAPVRAILEAVSAAFSNSAQIVVTCDPDLELPAVQVALLGRIAAEGVTNAIRHAFPDGRERRIWIKCEEERGRIRLSVRDNGIGISDFDDRAGAGHGLLEEAARQLGGVARMGSAAFGGGELALVFPRPA